MDIFLDTADVEEIKKYAFIIDGVTTNPSLIAKSGRKFSDVVKDICAIVDGPISAEVISTDALGMVNEAGPIAAIHPNIVIKIPLTPEGIKATAELSKKGIKTNVTLCFSANQALLAAKAGATYVSPFVGRLDDVDQDGMALIDEIRTIYDNYGFETKIIVASVRSLAHVKESAMLGADIATVPPKILAQMFQHPLTDIGLANFLKDWEKAKK